MELVLGILVIGVICFIAFNLWEGGEQRKQNMERRKRFVASLGENIRMIVNDGIHLFYIDDDKKVFGLDESGKTYSLSGLHGVSVYKDSVQFSHEDALTLCIGKECSREDTVALAPFWVHAIEREMMPVLRENLHKELEKEHIVPTCEYEHEGDIWGCDMKAKKFYCAYGCFNIYDFSDFRYVTVDDVSENRLCSSNYIMKVFVNNDFLGDVWNYDIYFDSRDETYWNLMTMFNKIKNQM